MVLMPHRLEHAQNVTKVVYVQDIPYLIYLLRAGAPQLVGTASWQKGLSNVMMEILMMPMDALLCAQLKINLNAVDKILMTFIV